MTMKALDIILYIFLILALVISVINISLISERSEKIKETVSLAQESQHIKIQKIQLIKIAASSCSDCFDIGPVIESLKKYNVNVTSERTLEFSSEEAKQLVSQYNIKKLPTVIVLGEVNGSIASLWDKNWQVETKDNMPISTVYSAIKPPYIDANGSIKGLVNLIHIIDQSCNECIDLKQVIGFFKQQDAKFSVEKTLNYTSEEAKELIERFSIREIPALIISNDILDYENIAKIWDQLNATEKQGFYALHTTVPPYRDISTGKIIGLVSVIYLNDSTCKDCYDVQINKIILERNFGLVIINETTFDINSNNGKAFIDKYNITKVPIMLASPDAKPYNLFSQVWLQIGSIENDGWYVMRKPEFIGTYKDLLSGQVILPLTEEQAGG